MSQILCGITMIGYVFWAAFNVLGVGMAGGTLKNAKTEYSLFGSVLLVSILACVLNFASKRGASVALSCIVFAALLIFWAVQSHEAPLITWPAFAWYVCPVAAFCAAVAYRSRSSLSSGRS